MNAKVYNLKGTEAGSIDLSEKIFGLSWNADLVHQVVVSMLSSARAPLAHTKTRGEVSGGGKKPWRQKGTGRARHGSTRSPIWVGGGVAHGPRNDKNYDRTVSRKMKAKALYTVLSKKFKDGEILFVDSLDVENGKTKNAKSVIATLGAIKGYESLASKRKNAALITIPAANQNVKRGFANFGSVVVDEIRNINPVELLNYKYLLIANPEESLKQIENKI